MVAYKGSWDDKADCCCCCCCCWCCCCCCHLPLRCKDGDCIMPPPPPSVLNLWMSVLVGLMGCSSGGETGLQGVLPVDSLDKDLSKIWVRTLFPMDGVAFFFLRLTLCFHPLRLLPFVRPSSSSWPCPPWRTSSADLPRQWAVATLAGTAAATGVTGAAEFP